MNIEEILKEMCQNTYENQEAEKELGRLQRRREELWKLLENRRRR